MGQQPHRRESTWPPPIRSEFREGAVKLVRTSSKSILDQAQQEADILVWDGGNNDALFFRPDLMLVLTDPLRSGDEVRYHPGETCLRMAEVILINKVDAATQRSSTRFLRTSGA